MPETFSWIKNFPEFELIGDKIFFQSLCKNHIQRLRFSVYYIVCEKKFQVDQHLKTSIHEAKLQKMKSGPIQQSVKTTFQNVGNQTRSETEVFHQDLCKALVAANIPLKKLHNTHFKEFLQKHCNQNIPDESNI
ncbi:hypothetical protein NQ314_013627 [Rhamnusium bicolor]|uniref:Uncharacterized protein n=1 Tax=Rhamnusium bicolor TaxID=1586634 RepID=A0AAV8X6H8_9CUCU|nr:hypothetical protein NQ314_013627 [Rhamnusium bicolor]